MDWENKITGYVSEKEISFIEGEIVHEWHGNMPDRKYETRYDILASIDMAKTISIDDRGLIKITGVGSEVYDAILTYFKNRREDG